nr:hypothetical protein [Tanacetum cinerariifolium]
KDYNSEKDLQVSKLKMQTNDSSLPGSGAKNLIGVSNYIREKPTRVVPPIEAAL